MALIINYPARGIRWTWHIAPGTGAPWRTRTVARRRRRLAAMALVAVASWAWTLTRAP